MPPKISAHDQARLGAATGGILLLWIAGGAVLIMVPLGIAFLTTGQPMTGGAIVATGVAIFLVVFIRHFRIIRRSRTVEDFFPDR